MADNATGVDPTVRVPRAVREQSERAHAAQLASIGQAEPPIIPPATPPDPNAPPAGTTPPVTSGVTPPATAAPAAPAAPDPQEPPPDPNLPVDWEARYKTLHGRFEAERKRQREQVESMSGRVQQLERQLTTTAQPPKLPAAPLNLTEDEINDYGEDFIGVVRKVAEHVVSGQIAPIVGDLGRTKAQIGVQQNQTMHQQMDALYPEWQRMNAFPGFIEWTLLPDPYSGAIRQRLMQDAWDAGDARRVNAFFQGFLAEEAALNPAGSIPPPAAPAPAAPNGAPAATPPLALASLAAPGGTRSASQMPAEKRMYTTEDITRFYTEVAAGKWRNREADRAAIDADISRAQHENRIIFNQRRYTPPSPPEGFTR